MQAQRRIARQETRSSPTHRRTDPRSTYVSRCHHSSVTPGDGDPPNPFGRDDELCGRRPIAERQSAVWRSSAARARPYPTQVAFRVESTPRSAERPHRVSRSRTGAVAWRTRSENGNRASELPSCRSMRRQRRRAVPRSVRARLRPEGALPRRHDARSAAVPPRHPSVRQCHQSAQADRQVLGALGRRVRDQPHLARSELGERVPWKAGPMTPTRSPFVAVLHSAARSLHRQPRASLVLEDQHVDGGRRRTGRSTDRCWHLVEREAVRVAGSRFDHCSVRPFAPSNSAPTSSGIPARSPAQPWTIHFVVPGR